MNYDVGPKELAHIFGFKDESWIHQLVKKHGAPPPKSHKYNLPAWVQWREREWKEETRRARSASLSDVEKKMAEVELEDAQLDLAKKKGELISVPEVQKLWDRVVLAVKHRMESQGNRLSATLLNLTQFSQPKKILDEDNQETLNELANGNYSDPESDLPVPRKAGTLQTHRKAVRADTAAKRKRVGGQVRNAER